MKSSATESKSHAGVSISSTSLDLVLIDSDGRSLMNRSAELQFDRSIADQIHELILENNSDIRTLGIALPGMIDTKQQVVVESRIAELRGLNLRSELGELVDGHIVVENDANAAAFAEFKFGAAKTKSNFILISIGDGIGGGLVIDGKLWRGSHGFAGELGAIVVDDEGTRLEDVASVPNIVRRTQNRFHQDSTSILNKVEEHEIALKDILGAAALEDDLALLMLERTGTYIGTAIAAVLNVLDLEMIVLAGEITRSNGIFLNAINDRLRKCTSARTFGHTATAVSELDGTASAIGAAMLAAGIGA